MAFTENCQQPLTAPTVNGTNYQYYRMVNEIVKCAAVNSLLQY